jgi:hypothetical protein
MPANSGVLMCANDMATMKIRKEAIAHAYSPTGTRAFLCFFLSKLLRYCFFRASLVISISEVLGPMVTRDTTTRDTAHEADQKKSGSKIGRIVAQSKCA